jgi:hypothetical protein
MDHPLAEKSTRRLIATARVVTARLMLADSLLVRVMRQVHLQMTYA